MSQSVRRNTHAVVQSALESALEFQFEGPEHPQPSPTHIPYTHQWLPYFGIRAGSRG